MGGKREEYNNFDTPGWLRGNSTGFVNQRAQALRGFESHTRLQFYSVIRLVAMAFGLEPNITGVRVPHGRPFTL